jgi:YebC/PmpR family DNA-binding regulatory protein
MSGHSRWSQIKHKKGLTDQKRGQIFSKISKLITIAARKGTDPKLNPILAQAINKARQANMPNENIERAIKKISDPSNQLEELVIEVVGPESIALRIKAVTDNKNRTISEIKKILTDHQSKIVPPGSLAWMFNLPANPGSETRKEIYRLLEDLDNHSDVSEITSNLQ